MSDIKRTYVWEFPVRFTHWVNVLCIIVLSITGYYISNPFIYALSSKQQIMGLVRLTHFIAAYTFMMSVIIRLYWSLFGNEYACIKEWFPFSGEKLRTIGAELKFYLLISKKPLPNTGHTSLAGITILLVYAGFIFQIISGFAMYSLTHSGVIWNALGGWLLAYIDLPMIKLYHHLAMYVIGAFIMGHIYIAWFADIRERNGVIGSIFSGYKFMSNHK